MLKSLFLATSLVPALLVAQDGRECVLDRKVHQESFQPQVPEVPRLCDTLGMKGRQVDIGGCSLYVEEEGGGHPMVLLHGGPGGTHHAFHPWFHRAAAFARVVYYDQRGCGRSEWKPGPGYSVEQGVEDLENLRKTLGYDRWTVVGWSYGGFLAQLYALRHPEHVAGLVLIGAEPGLQQAFPSREQDYLTAGERTHLEELTPAADALRKSKGLDDQNYVALRIFNATLNGDWKRQQFYRPTREQAARLARYEWNNPMNFNEDVGQSMDRYHLEGAFQGCPIPTLLMEGKWDLTWGEGKAKALLANHPGAALHSFERAGHPIFSEDTTAFFKTLRAFQEGLRRPSQASLEAFSRHAAPWSTMIDHPVEPIRWGAATSRAIREERTGAWIARHPDSIGILRLGLAQYDGRAFEPALAAFRDLERAATSAEETPIALLAILWQGHMLDLLGRREEAVACYTRVADQHSESALSNSQYGLSIKASEYARIRMKEPFTFLVNQDPG